MFIPSHFPSFQCYDLNVESQPNRKKLTESSLGKIGIQTILLYYRRNVLM
jgi:hypothetical protein